MLRVFSVLLLVLGLIAVSWGVLVLTQDTSDRPDIAPSVSVPPAPAPVSEELPGDLDAGDFETEGAFRTEGTSPTSLDRLREVPIAHETPLTAQLGDPFEVSLSMDATGAASAARTLPGRGNIVEDTAMVGDDAKALLTGTAFAIEALSPETQGLSPFSANTWRWRVTPEAAGAQDLIIEIFAMDGERALPVRSFRDTVTVQVSTVGQLLSAAESANPFVVLLGGIGSIVGGAFGVFRFFRK